MGVGKRRARTAPETIQRTMSEKRRVVETPISNVGVRGAGERRGGETK